MKAYKLCWVTLQEKGNAAPAHFPRESSYETSKFPLKCRNDGHLAPSAKANLASSSPPYIQQDLAFHPCPIYTFSALPVFLQEHRGARSSKNVSQVSAKTQDLKVVGRGARIRCKGQTETVPASLCMKDPLATGFNIQGYHQKDRSLVRAESVHITENSRPENQSAKEARKHISPSQCPLCILYHHFPFLCVLKFPQSTLSLLLHIGRGPANYLKAILSSLT